MLFVPGVCYGDTGNEVETEGNGMLHCKMGSLFAGRSSFHPGESREGLAGVSSGPLVICSDCYDNANIYTRTREYCQYAYLGEDDPLDRALPGLKGGPVDDAHLKDTALEGFMHDQESSVYLPSPEKRYNIKHLKVFLRKVAIIDLVDAQIRLYQTCFYCMSILVIDLSNLQRIFSIDIVNPKVNPQSCL
ncbi:hypothetical protein XENORESO_002165 [Xenotaenia resolanae]|uniref:Uncharacterized protein n=1 Tax=Xenotaenia resolanae TaxID=208358 RepID=A0ABV0WC45_9TELE